MAQSNPALCGILPVDKSPNSTSFSLVSQLRKKTGIEKIGHAGTLDPFATGVMVMLIGKSYTVLSERYLTADKQYHATLRLGIATDTYDTDGVIVAQSDLKPSPAAIEQALLSFQGECLQTPPMFSAKKVNGKKLYDLARKGLSLERAAVRVQLTTQLLSYNYPHIELLINCSKGTYIRALAHDLGQLLGCGAHLSALVRTRSGTYTLSDCVSQEQLKDPHFDYTPYLRKAL